MTDISTELRKFDHEAPLWKAIKAIEPRLTVGEALAEIDARLRREHTSMTLKQAVEWILNAAQTHQWQTQKCKVGEYQLTACYRANGKIEVTIMHGGLKEGWDLEPDSRVILEKLNQFIDKSEALK